MIPDLLAALQFQHPWLSDEFAAESQRLALEERSKKHHYVPVFYLSKWAVNGYVQPTQVDTRTAYRPQPPKEVAHQTNFYSLPATDDTMDIPLKWVETHLSRIENACAHRYRELETLGVGLVEDDSLKRDLAVFLGLQLARTVSQRERHLVIIKSSDSTKRALLKHLWPNLTNEQIDATMRNQHADPKHEAIELMRKDVRNVLAESLYRREWAVYATSDPIATCDDPVAMIAGPPVPRSVSLGATFSAVILHPLDAHHVLVMLRSGLRHRGPFQLDHEETHSINVEIVAAATRTAFERPGDAIAVDIDIPPRQPAIETDAAAAALGADEAIAITLRNGTARSRWTELGMGPTWPIPRWYRP